MNLTIGCVYIITSAGAVSTTVVVVLVVVIAAACMYAEWIFYICLVLILILICNRLGDRERGRERGRESSRKRKGCLEETRKTSIIVKCSDSVDIYIIQNIIVIII